MISFLIQHFRALKLSINQLSVQPLTTFLTFAVIGVVLALPMGLYLLLQNAQTVTSGLHQTTQISLYLKKNIRPFQVEKLLQGLKRDKNIVSTKYISATQGLAELQKQYNFGNILMELNNNPLPGVVVVQPVKSLYTEAQIKPLLAHLKKLPQVHDAQLDFAWLKRLNAIINLGRHIVYAAMLLFAFGVLLIVGNTIGLITQKYQDEIFVSQLLGATNSFIRRPFLYSGMIYGLLGGIIAWFLIDTTMWWMSGSVTKLATLYGSQFHLQVLSSNATLFLLVGGAVLGYFGSWLAVGRHVNM
ncbi:MAG: permease-like cell division protein FtsX [Gammaproteobacteria bacterium]|jgi:cell division transport system permease protein